MTDDEIIFTEKYVFPGMDLLNIIRLINYIIYLYYVFTCRLFELVEVASLVEESLEDAVT